MGNPDLKLIIKLIIMKMIIHHHRAFHISCTSQDETRLEETQKGPV